MQKLFFLIFFQLILTTVNAQQPILGWAREAVGKLFSEGTSIAVDSSGNSYITGAFAGIYDFDPGEEEYKLTASGYHLLLGNAANTITDIFILKLDPNGKLLWAKNIGGTGVDQASCITLDKAGNVYISGSFQKEADFDPGSDTFFLEAKGMPDAFLLKLDADGNFKWARRFGGNQYSYGVSVAIDIFGNICITGAYRGLDADFDPGPGTYYLEPKGYRDMYVLKLDNEGQFLWAKNIGGDYLAYGISITTDKSGNIYIAGSFKGQIDFDPGAGSYLMKVNGDFRKPMLSASDGFILKLDAYGNFKWARQTGGDGFDAVTAILADHKGNLYATGYFSETTDLDPGVPVNNVSSNGKMDIYLMKLDTSGGLIWVKNFGGKSDDMGLALACDRAGNIYTIGLYSKTVDFLRNTTLKSKGNTDIFILKTNPQGEPLWVFGIGGKNRDIGAAITTDPSGNIMATGAYLSRVDFDPGEKKVILTATVQSLFVIKFVQP